MYFFMWMKNKIPVKHSEKKHVVVLFTKAFALVGGAVNEHLGTDNIPKW